MTASNGTAPDDTEQVSLVAQYEPPQFTADSPPAATAGTPYSYQFQAINAGTHSITYTASGLPGWAALNPTTGVLSGTPNADGTFDYSVTASNGISPDTTVPETLIVSGQTAVTFNVAAGTSFTVPYGNYTGGTTFNVGAGATVTIDEGSFTGGIVFNLAAGAVVNISSSPSIAGTIIGSGSGTVNIGNGRLYIGTGGATFDFPGNMLQWTSGQMDLGDGNLTNLGTMTITGFVDFYNDGILYNYGTIIQTGAGNLQLGTDGTFPSTLDNEPTGKYLLEGDGGLTEISDSGNANGQTSLINDGLIQKTAGTGTSPLDVLGAITSNGTIEADTGAIALSTPLGLNQIANNSLTGGTWIAKNGAALDFPSGTDITSSAANITLSGAGATISGLTALSSNSGNFALTAGATFTASGAFGNTGTLTLGPGSTLTIDGGFTQAHTATLIEQIGGTPGSGQYGQANITAAAALDGTFTLNLVNGFTPAAGQNYQVLSFNSASGNFATFTGFGSTFSETRNTNSLVIGTFANPIDLKTASVSASSIRGVRAIDHDQLADGQPEQHEYDCKLAGQRLPLDHSDDNRQLDPAGQCDAHRHRGQRFLQGQLDGRPPRTRAGRLLRTRPDG